MKPTIQSTILIVAIILIASESVFPQAAYPSPRTGHSMVAIDTLIYVFGGESVKSTDQKAVLLNNLSKYDVKKSEWQEELPVNEPPTGRKKHSSTTYNGKIIISFGETQTGYSNEIWEYSPATKMWEQITITGDNIAPRADHAAVQVDELLYVAGGHDESQLFYDAYRINVNTGVCEQLPNPNPYDFNGPIGKAGVHVQGVPYFFGGWDENYAYLNIASFIPDGDYWSYRYGCPVAGFMGATTMGTDSWVYLVGGSGTSKNVLLSTVYRYNTSTTSLELISDDIPAGTYYNLVTSFVTEQNDSILYFWGGQDNQSFYRYTLNYNTTEIYNPATESWNIVGIYTNTPATEILEVYPNPAGDKISIRTDEREYEIELINSFGQVLLNEKNLKEINVKRFSPGLYFLKLNCENYTRSKRIIVH